MSRISWNWNSPLRALPAGWNCPNRATFTTCCAARSVFASHRQRRSDVANQNHDRNPTTPAAMKFNRPRRIDLSKLHLLSGYEKLDLFSTTLAQKLIPESLQIFEILKENNIAARLKYESYHSLFHLLISDPIKYRTEILDVVSTLRRFGYPPSQSMLLTLISCCVRWRDLELANEIYQEMNSKKLDLDIERYNDLLQLHEQHSGAAQLHRGIDIWHQMQSNGLKPTTTTYNRVLSMYGKLGQAVQCREIYESALSEFNPPAGHRVSKEHTERTASGFYALQAAYLSALVASKANDAVMVVVKSLYKPGGLLSSDLLRYPKHTLAIYSILLKFYENTQDRTAALACWRELLRRGVRPDVIMYGRMICIVGADPASGTAVTSAESLFTEAVERLPAAPRSGKLSKLRTSLLKVYAQHNLTQRVLSLFHEMKVDAGEKPLLRTAVKVVVDVLEKNGQTEEAHAILLREIDHARSSNLTPSSGPGNDRNTGADSV
ncbi:hypothetical protein BC832DRAFT_545792 [Gaertneriomyces semiglobifer]|nr:hypothetical protein BC832DRAFT_545792 [Gaertneriomyces semiglobifer]